MATSDIVNAFISHTVAQDADALGELFAEEIDWNVPGNGDLPWTGRRSRGEQVPEYFRTMWPRFVEGKSVVALDKIVVSGDDAVVFAHFEHTAVDTGRTFSTPVAMRFEVRDERIVLMHLFEDTAAVSAAFFG
jgi:ketosteroid isomerase-like protein